MSATNRGRWAGTPVAVVMVALTVFALGRLALDDGDTGPVSGTPIAEIAPGQSGPGRAEPVVPKGPPLEGKVVVLDPGHQAGNRRFPSEINRAVQAGGFLQPCNTTGTSTRSGYTESTLAWQVTKLVEKRLQELGATVQLTRATNSTSKWGPCVDRRGRAGNDRGADLKISIHADDATRDSSGFRVVAPADRRPWTHDIFQPSRLLAKRTLAAFQAAGLQQASGTGPDGITFARDQAVLNLADIPSVIVQLGNMRSRTDVALMQSKAGRIAYADALVDAVRRGLRPTSE